MMISFSLKNKLFIKYSNILSSINQLEVEYQTLEDWQLKRKTAVLSTKIKNLKNDIFSNDLVIESFALAREAAKRTINLRHYDTQILGGLILNEGKIAEMATGEGKTLVATSPIFLNALSKKGVHVVTVNPYLAQRDSEWMGQIYRFLGLKTGLITSKMSLIERKKNYNRDITYITNSELGFDFLRDNLAQTTSALVQRPFNFCIIDEVDSILIDEARTPLIISNQVNIELEKIIKSNEVIKFLLLYRHYEINEKTRNISLTKYGIKKIERLLQVNNIYDLTQPWIHFILNGLKAHHLFIKDVHYLVKNNEVIIVDEFTGRLLIGRKWCDGLQTAIEVKEGIFNFKGNRTIASITYQNFFCLYPKLSGMTGTAKTEELEFEDIYKISVSAIPSYKPMIRKDHNDYIYINDIAKWQAISNECRKMFHIGRPVLVGTTTIKNSELLSQLLVYYNIPHKLLNAKPQYIKSESEIISQAGCLYSITIATNMAGRGTDILLGGNIKYRAKNYLLYLIRQIIHKNKIKKDHIVNFSILQLVNLLLKYKHLLRTINFYYFDNWLQQIQLMELSLKEEKTFSLKNYYKLVDIIKSLYKQLFKQYNKFYQQEHKKVLSLGGLYVIGTERHESRRIDNQLRGRAGRQGDPGESRFFLSLNDNLLRIFGGEKITKLLIKLNYQTPTQPIELKLINSLLDSAQQKVEGLYYEQRKILNQYDQILNKHRILLYKFRRKILFSSNTRLITLELIENMVEDIINLLYGSYNSDKLYNKNASTLRLIGLLYSITLSFDSNTPLPNVSNKKFVKIFLIQQAWSFYSKKEIWCSFIDPSLFTQFEKLIMLKYLDFHWGKHLENINFIKETVKWEVYAQKDPFILFKNEANKSLNKTLKYYRDNVIYTLLTSKFSLI